MTTLRSLYVAADKARAEQERFTDDRSSTGLTPYWHARNTYVDRYNDAFEASRPLRTALVKFLSKETAASGDAMARAVALYWDVAVGDEA